MGQDLIPKYEEGLGTMKSQETHSPIGKLWWRVVRNWAIYGLKKSLLSTLPMMVAYKPRQMPTLHHPEIYSQVLGKEKINLEFWKW